MGWLSDLLFGDNGRNSELSKAKSVNKSGHPFVIKKTIYDSPFAQECGVTAKAYFECDGLIYQIRWTSYTFSEYACIKSLDKSFECYSYKKTENSDRKNTRCFGNARKLTIDEYKKLFDETNGYGNKEIIADILLKYNPYLSDNSLKINYNTEPFKFLGLYHIKYNHDFYVFNGEEIVEKFDFDTIINKYRFSTYRSDHESKFDYDYNLYYAHVKHVGKDKFIDTIVGANIQYMDDSIDGVDLKSVVEKYELKMLKVEYDQIDEFIQDILSVHQELNKKLDSNEILELVDIVDYDTLVLFIKNVHNYKNIIDFESLKWRGSNALSERNRMHIEQYLKGII